MSDAHIYSRCGCPYSARARDLLREHGIPFREEFPDAEDRRALAYNFGYTTLPIILLRRRNKTTAVLGCDKLAEALKFMCPRPR